MAQALAIPILYASAAIGGYASYQQAQAYNKSAQYNADAVAIEQKQVAVQEAEGEAKNAMKTNQLVGAQRAAYGASGVETNSGTALDVQSQTRELGQVDTMTMRMNASNQTDALQKQKMGYLASKQNAGLSAAKTIMGDLSMRSVLKGGGQNMFGGIF